MADEGGVEFACQAMGSLQHFVRSSRSTMDCSGRYLPMSCRGNCREECLALTLLSAQQHDQSDTRDYCLAALLAEDANGNSSTLADAAWRFYSDLKSGGFLLLPVPLKVIQNIAEFRCRSCAFKLQ